MSLAKKCDICGRLYEPYCGANGISIEQIDRYGNVSTTCRTLDLRPTCKEKLENFIESLREGDE